MAEHTLKVEFFTLIPPLKMDQPYEQVRQALARVSIPVMVEGVPLRVESFQQTPDYICGTACRVELTNLPMIIRPDQPGVKAKPLEKVLNHDEGIGRPTAFIVSRVGNAIVVGLHRNHGGLRSRGFVALIERLFEGPIGDGFILAPIIEPSKVDAVLGWRTYRKFSARIATPQSPNLYETETLQDAARISAEAQSRSIQIELSMGHARGTLDLHTVRSAIRELLTLRGRKDRGTVESLVIKGRDLEDDKAEKIDLIQHHLVKYVPIPGQRRTLEPALLESAVQQAFIQAQGDLVEYYGRQ